MKGHFSVIETFIDDNATAVISEDVYEPAHESGLFIVHEIQLTVGASKPLFLWSHEIPRVIALLQQAKDLAVERTQEFYLNDEAEALSAPL